MHNSGSRRRRRRGQIMTMKFMSCNFYHSIKIKKKNHKLLKLDKKETNPQQFVDGQYRNLQIMRHNHSKVVIYD